MPTDLETKAFQKSIEKVTARWAKKVQKPLADLEKVLRGLAELKKKGELGPDDQKKQKQLEALAAKLKKQIEKANTEYRLEVMILTPPPEKDGRSLLKNVEPLLDKYKKGLPLGKAWTLKPKLEVDLKKRKFKKFELKLTWKF